MPIALGTRLGPYEVLGTLGAGGMGEVYKANDTRLDRSVAIKVLPAHLSGDPIFRQRFEREAKAVSSLNHPHICALFDVGRQDGIDYLVMECLDGETLQARLEQGPLPLKELLRVAMQIADGLDKAHRQGIVHRDLKPGNIMLTKSGVKLLDFGLAKVMADLEGLASATSAPTVSAPLTAQGTILGTFQYMSPEQLEGREADARSDVFAFGAVLYEMATGRRAFRGETQGSVIAAILKDEPAPMSALAPATPPALDRLVRTCLEKDPDERRQSMHDVLLELKWIAAAGSQAGEPAPVVSRRQVRHRLTQAAALVLALTTIALAIAVVQRTPKAAQSFRLTAEIGADAGLATAGGPAAILSPDGSRLAFLATGTDRQVRLYVRGLDQLQAVPLSGTQGADDHFFSPDGQWIGFFADGKLKKVSVEGGAPATLCEARGVGGGSWGEEGTIVFASRSQGLSIVSAAGGVPEPISLDKQAAEVTHRWPQMLPGGQAVLFTSSSFSLNYQDADMVVYSLATRQRKTVHRGGYYPRYLRSGHLAYVNESTLFVVPFDLKRLEVTGPAAPVFDGIVSSPGVGGAQVSFSETGSVAYLAGASSGRNLSIYWMDHRGTFTPLRETPGEYSTPRFSPDGERLALNVSDGKRTDIWVYDLKRETPTRITFGGEANRYPAWTPDGLRVAYQSREKGGAAGLFWVRADGSGDPQRLTESKANQVPTSWDPDGRLLAFQQDNPGSGGDIMTLSVEGSEASGWKPGEPTPFLNSPTSEWRAAFSPDGRWMAYTSGESGNDEVYVRPFPGPGSKWQISSGGGAIPRWSPTKKELFYRTPDNRIMVATYTATVDGFQAEKARPWSSAQFSSAALGDATSFDLHPDGKRFAVLMPPGRVEAPKVDRVTFVFNFFDELRRRTAK